MSSYVEDNVKPDYDQVIIDIADYVLNKKLIALSLMKQHVCV